MRASTIRLSVVLPAKPAKVFEALTNSAQIKKWSGQKAKVGPRPGSKLEMFDGWVKGNVLEYKPGRSLVYSWRPDDWPEDAEESIVRYTLVPTPRGTKILLEHLNLPDSKEKKNHESGWKEFVLDPLTSYFSTQQ